MDLQMSDRQPVMSEYGIHRGTLR